MKRKRQNIKQNSDNLVYIVGTDKNLPLLRQVLKKIALERIICIKNLKGGTKCLKTCPYHLSLSIQQNIEGDCPSLPFTFLMEVPMVCSAR